MGRASLMAVRSPATFIGYTSGAGNYILIDEHGVQFESRNVEFDEGVPHRTLDVGERLWMEDDAPVDLVPSNCAQSIAANSVPSTSSSVPDEKVSMPASRSHSPDPEPGTAPPPDPPRRSGRNTTTTTRAAESREYVQRKMLLER
ncbi:hypothetical protein MVEN_00128600 [Mycena venus]|uniref:Uncharacterized protein n=1 Tax=Mycena venus TaxID=2733690 RepID=A0A8H7DFP1_9AGAR|nr:hypothetical protein MVEN_00128600 [Mycena venus]